MIKRLMCRLIGHRTGRKIEDAQLRSATRDGADVIILRCSWFCARCGHRLGDSSLVQPVEPPGAAVVDWFTRRKRR